MRMNVAGDRRAQVEVSNPESALCRMPAEERQLPDRVRRKSDAATLAGRGRGGATRRNLPDSPPREWHGAPGVGRHRMFWTHRVRDSLSRRPTRLPAEASGRPSRSLILGGNMTEHRPIDPVSRTVRVAAPRIWKL